MDSKQRINYLFGKIYANCGEGSRAWREAEEIEKLIEEREKTLVDALQKILESSTRNYDRSRLRAFSEIQQMVNDAFTKLDLKPAATTHWPSMVYGTEPTKP